MADMHGNSPKTLRQELLKQRKEFAAGNNYAPASGAIITSLNTFLENEGAYLKAIALYWPIQDELDLRPALIEWSNQSADRQLALPFARPDKQLDFYRWATGDSLIPNQHGVPEPDPNNPNRPAISPECILIPCVGWSRSELNGKSRYWRFGYGGGYFDRTLSVLRKKNPKLICIGIGFGWQKLNGNQWTAQNHDEPLDKLLTESGLHH
ncbi:5-formyltetrahydrofolate cyclo-ligase [Polynucleobacter necessarius]|uniref:5-formyltetrahydrofolate cyclo-ligase n=1 Tax=Polynucleobacter necessarius TaxID=576610 RepID=UPI000E096D70|nr:5-formyltetrahydrofolate cyclo-ligase [Polynucleobacter necessarius]